MKKTLFGGLLLSLISACVAPINTSLESARMLKKRAFEAEGHYTHYAFSYEGESDAVNNNVGFRLGYGVSDRFNVKLRYERLVPVDEDGSGVNYFDLAPKFQIIPGKIAGTMPIGVYFTDEGSDFVLSPKMLFTYPVNDKFEATIATKADIFPEDEVNVYLGANLGLGISSNLNRWALRPELGLMIDPGESGIAWAYGLGLSVVFPGKNASTD